MQMAAILLDLPGQLFSLVLQRWDGSTWFGKTNQFHNGLSFNGLPSLNRLSTKDRLIAWGALNDGGCVLCNGDLECHSHLFFACQFTTWIWLRIQGRCIQGRCGVSPYAWDLNSEVQWGISNSRKGSVLSLLFKLSLSASIYYIWKERNSRTFQEVGHDLATVEKLIVDEVRSCAVSWRTEEDSQDH